MFKGINYLFKFCFKTEKMYIISLLVAEILNSVVIVAGMIMPKFIIDELFITKRNQYTLYYLGIYLGILFIGNLLISYSKFVSEKKRDSFYTKFSVLHGEQLLETDYKNLESPVFLDLREKAMKYINSYGFAGIIPITIMLFGKVLVLSSILVIISTLNITVIFIYLVLIAISTYANARFKKENIKVNLEMTESERRAAYLKSITVESKYSKEIRLSNLSSWILKKYSNQLDSINNLKKRRNKNNNYAMSINTVINFVQQGVAYVYLCIGVFSKGISMGSFTMYLNAISSFHSNINDVINTVIDLNQYTIYFKYFKEFMEYPKTLREGENLSIENLNIDKYEIEFINVSFKYPGQEKYALKNVSVKMMPGEKFSVVGENGAGKTTFIKLLTRLYDPTEGRILVNGIDIKQFNYDEYMKLFSVVFQDFKLFALSVKENIVLANSDTSNDKKIMLDAEESGISKKILSLKEGLQTPVYKIFDENGFEPSGGEGQKIAIARALYKNSPIVILDEPTSALDPRAEAEIYMNFHKLVRNRTAIYISHRLASSKACDKVLVFKDGQIIEEGPHEQLISQNGLYAELFEMQAQFYRNDRKEETGVV